MTTFLAAFIVIALSVAALAVGVLFGRPAIKGSCGGIGCSDCGGCSRKAHKDKGL